MTARMGCAVDWECHRSSPHTAAMNLVLNAREEAESEDGNGTRTLRSSHLPGNCRDGPKRCSSQDQRELLFSGRTCRRLFLSSKRPGKAFRHLQERKRGDCHIADNGGLFWGRINVGRRDAAIGNGHGNNQLRGDENRETRHAACAA